MPSVDDPRHKQLEDDVTAFVEALGYTTETLTYHDHLSETSAKALSRITDPTAMITRTKNDRMAFASGYPTFWYEAKTTDHSTGNMGIEALPLFWHVIGNHLFGTRTLYCMRRFYGREVFDRGMWATTTAPINALFIVKRHGHEAIQEVVSRLAKKMDIEIIELGSTAGSGDSFVRILSEDYLGLTDWRECIRAIQRENSGTAT